MANIPASRKRALYAPITIKRTPVVNQNISTLQRYVNPAVKVAEGNPRNFGVLSEEVSSPTQANAILNESIQNNYLRWLQAGQPGKFVDWMRDRWAPLDASNDPKNLNYNWAPNVRRNLRKQLGPENYRRWKALNIALASQEDTNAFS